MVNNYVPPEHISTVNYFFNKAIITYTVLVYWRYKLYKHYVPACIFQFTDYEKHDSSSVELCCLLLLVYQ